MVQSSNLEDAGLLVVDAQGEGAFESRQPRRHSIGSQLESMERIAHAFVDAPDTILQELVNAGVVLCGADSAGISIEKEDATDAEFYRWVATAGSIRGFWMRCYRGIRARAGCAWSADGHRCFAWGSGSSTFWGLKLRW